MFVLDPWGDKILKKINVSKLELQASMIQSIKMSNSAIANANNSFMVIGYTFRESKFTTFCLSS